jgi:16S rRNA (adenine1518-N6/adenine1519-N6)-dimethyltransferase
MDRPRPLKRFGQNYLIDKNTIRKIINEFDPQLNDVVIEIGPGTGALTAHLVELIKNFFAVEVDKRVVDDLRVQFPTAHIINQDFLKSELNNIVETSQRVRIIGNIPYNITSPIIFKLFENRSKVKDAMLMVQYEVAKRITAKERSDDYGILGVLVNYFASTELCFKIPPSVFYPKPKVDSAIIRMRFDKNFSTNHDDKLFIKVVKAAFGNRRKTLKNSLSNSIFGKLDFNKFDFDLSKRAEELSINQFVELTNLIRKHQ